MLGAFNKDRFKMYLKFLLEGSEAPPQVLTDESQQKAFPRIPVKTRLATAFLSRWTGPGQEADFGNIFM